MPTNLLKKESNTVVFLWNFFKNLFLQNTPADCFWKEKVKLSNSYVDKKLDYEKQWYCLLHQNLIHVFNYMLCFKKDICCEIANNLKIAYYYLTINVVIIRIIVEL